MFVSTIIAFLEKAKKAQKRRIKNNKVLGIKPFGQLPLPRLDIFIACTECSFSVGQPISFEWDKLSLCRTTGSL